MFPIRRPLGSEASEEIDKVHGWARYEDTVYTESNPLVVASGTEVILPNNAGTIIDTYLPTDSPTLYNGVTNKLLPLSLGDSYLLRIDFKAYTSINSGYGEIRLDVGGEIGNVLEIPVSFPRGIGVNNIRSVSRSSLIYSLDTFMSNNGTIHYESVRGDTTIYDIVYVIHRLSRGSI